MNLKGTEHTKKVHMLLMPPACLKTRKMVEINTSPLTHKFNLGFKILAEECVIVVLFHLFIFGFPFLQDEEGVPQLAKGKHKYLSTFPFV